MSPPDAGPGTGTRGRKPPHEHEPEARHGNGAGDDGVHELLEKWPFFAAVWAKLDGGQRWMLSEPWPGPDIEDLRLVNACVSLLHRHGMTHDQIVRTAEFFPASFGKFPAYAKLIEQALRELLKEEAKEAAEAAARQKEADRLAQILIVTDEPWDPATLPGRPWLAPPYLMRGEITLLHGPGGGGKSQLLIAWAVANALGKQLGRLRPTQRSRIILTNFEDNAIEQMRRISAALEYFGATPADLKGWLFRVTLGPTADATMFELDEFGSVRTTETWDALQSACKTIKPDGVALDPLVAINAVPERDNQLMRRVMVLLKSEIAVRYHVAVMLAHHDNKGGGDNESSDQNNARGGGDIVNAVRFELACKKMTAAQADQMGVKADRRGFSS